jgi:hypothetical protein
MFRLRFVVGAGRALCASLAGACLIAAAAAPLGAQNHPFGAHPVAYAPGAILPDHVPQSVLDQAVRDFYDDWKSAYLVQTCGPGRYVVATHVAAGNLTVSEGHGYGMILAALMAGHDPDARAIFDGMYAYFREHPTAGHDDLMAWNQKTSCADAPNGDSSATDGDLDIAYALLLADKQWGSCGAVDYLGAALEVLADVEGGELDATASYPLLGNWVSPSDPTYYPATRSSDFMPGHFRSFAAATADADWTALADSVYDVIDDVQTTHSPVTGLLPDFIIDPLALMDPPGAPAPAPPLFLEAPTDGSYSYNACRDPWRIASDFVLTGDARAATAAGRITSWFRSATGDDPEAITSGYHLDGTPVAGTDYRSMAFVAPLGVAATTGASHQAWLDDLWDLVAGTPVEAEGYYENTLKLLSMIVMSGNWWAPELVTGGCVPSGTPLCTDGGALAGVQMTFSRVTSPPGEQGLKVKGSLFFAQGTPVASLAEGAQVLVEDLGAGSAALLDVTTATAPIPSPAASACDPRDGWTVTAKTTTYRNVSGSVDAPACTPGSASGVRQLKYKPRSARDVAFGLKARDAAIATPVGPVRMTLVLGDDAAASGAGECGIGAQLACTAKGTKVVCR